ncbi:hypothetical protein ROTAS13_01658 [Roseomonas sp. TAS13]|nr:hypothetical protein ROTAS13_01658 [Roseomonas sp. TAS13]
MEATTPAAVARKPRRIWRRACPRWRRAAMSFRLSTGRTHGIRLRTRPPSSATPRNGSRLPHPARVAPAATVPRVSDARCPSSKVTVTSEPGILTTSGPEVTGSSAVAVPRSALKENSGLPKVHRPLSTMTSGAESGCREEIRTSSAAGFPGSAATPSTASPDREPSSGTRAS